MTHAKPGRYAVVLLGLSGVSGLPRYRSGWGPPSKLSLSSRFRRRFVDTEGEDDVGDLARNFPTSPLIILSTVAHEFPISCL